MMTGGFRGTYPSGDVPPGLLQRIRSEFVEMPGLRLTACQAARLWGLDHAICERVLACLEDAGFLFVTRDGTFVRRG